MLNIPSVTRKAYARHFIKGAHLEIRFSTQKIDWPIFEKTLQNILNKYGFPAIKRQFTSLLQFQTDATNSDKINVIQSGSGIIDSLLATSADGLIVVQFKHDRVIFSNHQYNSFDKMLDLVTKLFAEVYSTNENTIINWVGVRKINEILATRDDGPGYNGEGVSAHFFNPIRDNFFPAEFIREAKNRYVIEKDGFSNIVDISSHRQTSNAYVVRIDIDVNNSRLNIGTNEMNKLAFVANQMNQSLFDIFHWVVSPDLIEVLEGK